MTSRASDVRAVPLPEDSRLRAHMAPGDFVDCFAAPAEITPRQAAEIIVDFPGWARALLALRRVATAPFGLSNDGPPADDKLGPFPVESETGDRDRRRVRRPSPELPDLGSEPRRRCLARDLGSPAQLRRARVPHGDPAVPCADRAERRRARLRGRGVTDTIATRAARATPQPVATRIRGLSDRAIAWIFVAPTIFLLLAVNIFPLIWTIRLSFTNFRANRNREVEWIGTRNYERILTDSTSGSPCRPPRISCSGRCSSRS